MTNLNESQNNLPVVGSQSTPGASINNGFDDDITLEEKLMLLGRTSYSRYFQELRNNQPVTAKLRNAYELLVQNPLSVNNRESAVGTTANLLWPAGSWTQVPPQLMYLQRPNEWSRQNISQRALIRVNQAKEAVSTVTLVGQHGRHEFDLGDPSQLYKLFEAVIDSEFTFLRKEEQRFEDALQQMEASQPTFLATPWLYAIIEQYGLYTPNDQDQLRSRARAIREETWDVKKRPYRMRSRQQNPFKAPFQPSKPSPMRNERLPHQYIPFHLITWPRIESVGLPANLAESFHLQSFITVEGEPVCACDEVDLFYLMGLAMFRLKEEGKDALAQELRELRVRLSRSRRGADAPFGSSSGQLTQGLVGLDDRVHIICREDAVNKIRTWVVDAGQGRKSWVVRVEKCSQNGLWNGSSLGKRGVPTAPRVYREIAPKRPRVA